MKKLSYIVVLLCSLWMSNAQIVSAEYFIDTDPGVGNGTSLSLSGNGIDQDLNIPTGGLSDGIHKLYVRVLSTTGEWSMYDQNVFYVNSTNENTASITSAEYFFDSDPGVGNGTPLSISGDNIDTNLNIPTSGLSGGIHKLYIRVINDDNTWSLYDQNVFYVNPSNINTANIASAEYFFDVDPGVENGTELSVTGNTVDVDFGIPTSGLSEGVHKLYIRVINDDNTWSLYDQNVFYVSGNNENTASIASAEYFFDTDPGVGNGNGLSLSGNTIDLDFDIPTSGLSDGIHKLYIRVINTDNNWSLYGNNVFYVSENNSNSALITAAEYFFDIDPGIGNGIAIDLDDAETFDEDLTIDVPNDLPDGDHFLYLRVQNTDGTWSLYAISEMLESLSTNEFALEGFKYYPNPVKDILYFDTNDHVITDLKIIDLNGRVILQITPEANQINLTDLNSGTYLVYLSTDMGSVSKKIIKQ